MPYDNASLNNFVQKQGGSLANLGASPTYTGAAASRGTPPGPQSQQPYMQANPNAAFQRNPMQPMGRPMPPTNVAQGMAPAQRPLQNLGMRPQQMDPRTRDPRMMRMQQQRMDPRMNPGAQMDPRMRMELMRRMQAKNGGGNMSRLGAPAMTTSPVQPNMPYRR